MGGIHVILGNNLAGAYVWPYSPVQVVTLISQVEVSESPISPLMALATCVATHSMCRAGDSGLNNPHRKSVSVFPVPVFPLPMSSSALVREQRSDFTLQALYSQVLPEDEVESAVHGYFLQDGL